MLIDHLQKLVEASDVASLWTLHAAHMEAYGFDRLLYGVIRNPTRTPLGDPTDLMTLSTHSDAYTRRFIDDQLYLAAPALRWFAQSSDPCSWAWISRQYRDGQLSPSEAAVYVFNQEMGVTAGYTVGFTSMSVRARGVIGLCARRGLSQNEVEEIWQTNGKQITLANRVFHLKLLQLPCGCPALLTQRQREVLEWVAEGKTVQDIATIMALNMTTVEKHLRLARQCLMVETTTQAVVKALSLNQIFCKMQ